MTFNWKTMLVGVLLLALIVVGEVANHYRDNATEYKKQRDEKTQELNLAKATITDMQTRQREVAALDAKYTKELSDAQENINQLERDVANGRKRLRLNATCKNNSTSAPGVDDAASARLTDAAQRDYFTLRERILVSGKQIAGLQE